MFFHFLSFNLFIFILNILLQKIIIYDNINNYDNLVIILDIKFLIYFLFSILLLKINVVLFKFKYF